MPVDPSGSPTGAPSVSQPQQSTDNSILGKDDFLKLLIGQMQNQDPMNPTDESQEMGQMTQFAILEQMTNLNSTEAASASNDYENQAVNLVGKQITYIRVSGSGDNARFTDVNARVDSVRFTSSGPILQVTMADGRREEVAPVSVTYVWGADGAPAVPPGDDGSDGDDGSAGGTGGVGDDDPARPDPTDGGSGS